MKPRLTTVNGKNRVEVEKDQRLQTDASGLNHHKINHKVDDFCS